ncbi:MAG TPA: peptidylprolyl isomerase [Pirellulaceae bacterium]|jgi:cyclophilin family peptidyl-prolyl cis-trans isomerase|nr:peptidylprolyl isomerase [Pirellulaceae bacterium]
MFVSKESLGLLLTVVIATCGCGGCSSESPPKANLETAPTGNSASGSTTSNEVSTVPMIHGAESPVPVGPQVEKFPEVTIVTSLGDIRVRLNAEKASETVDNFLYNYVDRGFYDGTVFHFVQDKFIAIAGGYDAELNAKEARPPIRNEASNGSKNVQGTIAMSRQSKYADSATSQFYLNLADNPKLDQTDTENGEAFGYCVFGEVVEGMDVLQRIAKVEVRDSGDFINVPIEPIVIKSVRRDK